VSPKARVPIIDDGGPPIISCRRPRTQLATVRSCVLRPTQHVVGNNRREEPSLQGHTKRIAPESRPEHHKTQLGFFGKSVAIRPFQHVDSCHK
jgi:hypothetical protein